jgi:hypothetical protein
MISGRGQGHGGGTLATLASTMTPAVLYFLTVIVDEWMRQIGKPTDQQTNQFRRLLGAYSLRLFFSHRHITFRLCKQPITTKIPA